MSAHGLPTLTQMLWPTLSNVQHLPVVMADNGRLALLPLRSLSADEIHLACVVHVNIDRGLLVVV